MKAKNKIFPIRSSKKTFGVKLNRNWLLKLKSTYIYLKTVGKDVIEKKSQLVSLRK